MCVFVHVGAPVCVLLLLMMKWCREWAYLEGKLCELAQFSCINVEGQCQITVLHCVANLHHRLGHNLV